MRPIKKSLALVFFPFCVCVRVGGGDLVFVFVN